MQWMEYSTLSKFILPLWVSHLEVEVAGLFHAYWAVSSYGLCFCRCFLTGFDHNLCSLPRNDFLLALFNTVAHKGHAANKKLLQNQWSCCKQKVVAANKKIIIAANKKISEANKSSCCKLSDRKLCAHTDGKRRTQYSCIQGPLTKCLA